MAVSHYGSGYLFLWSFTGDGGGVCVCLCVCVCGERVGVGVGGSTVVAYRLVVSSLASVWVQGAVGTRELTAIVHIIRTCVSLISLV